MLDATHTLFFIIGFLVLFSIVMPLVARITKISFTWTLVIVYLGILFGVILDFSHLTNEVRMILAIGSILVSVAYILSHVSEKARARGEQMRLPEMHVKKGNTHVNVKFADAKKIVSDDEDPVDLNDLSTLPYNNDDDSNFQTDIPQEVSIAMQNQSLRNTHERITAQENPYAVITPIPQSCVRSNRVLRPAPSLDNNVVDKDELGQIGVVDRRVRRDGNTGVHRMSSSQGFSSTRSGNWNQPQ